MNNPVGLSRARLAEADRRMIAAGVAEAARYYRQHAFLLGVLEDERSGLWSPFPAVDAPDATTPNPAPVAPALVHAPAVAPAAPEARARSVWSKAVAEANAEAQGDGTRLADPQADAQQVEQAPPNGSVQRSRSAWGRAVADANAELVRRGGKVSEV